MKKMDAMFEYWGNPDVSIVLAGQDDQIIDWLRQQTAGTWHRVATTWNYDHENRPLVWILKQKNCDRGTAAHVFCIEGAGHWLPEQISDTATDRGDDHVCRVVLSNWHRYGTGELKTECSWPDWTAEVVQKIKTKGALSGTPYEEVIGYEGVRDADSKYESDDGKIVIAFDHWVNMKGYQLDS